MQPDDAAKAGPAQDEVLRTARRYDEIPYVSIPDQALQPSRLCALARLFGLAPPAPSAARTLEIGCASGGHLIPLAAAHPDAHFTGIDISPVQIAEGQARIARLGLGNVRLEVRSFTELDAADGPFDYIVCHGVYSWVSEELSEKLLQACRETLAPDGIAAVSYNVLPGWRMCQMLRDAALFHTAGADSHQTRMAATRQLFEQVAEHADQNRAYGRTWREIAGQLLQLPDAYHAHDMFENLNRPVTFTQFAHAAARHGLAHLAEADFGANFPEAAGEAAGALIRSLSDGRLYAAEQYLDIVTGRTFRRSLLVHEACALTADRSMPDHRIDGIYLGAAPDSTLSEDAETGACQFAGGKNRISRIRDTATADALKTLLARRPAVSRLADLMPAVTADAALHGHLRNMLMDLLRHGLLEPAAEPLRCAPAAGDFPTAWPVALSDARAGLDRTATLRHTVFHLSPQARWLLALADGSRSRSGLADALFQRLAEGSATVSLAGKPVTDRQQLADIARSTVERELAAFAAAGLLLADNSI